MVAADPAVIGEPLLRDLRALWELRRGPRRLPARADFNMPDLKPFIGNLFLIDVLEGGQDFRFRLIGTNLTERFGRDVTGKTFSAVFYAHGPSAEADWLLGVYRKVAEEGTPVWSSSPMLQVHREFNRATALHLPLSTGGTFVGMILGATVVSLEPG